MKGSRFSEEQIIRILKEHNAGVPALEICRRHGISDAMSCIDERLSDGKEVRGLLWRNRLQTSMRHRS